MIRIRFTNYTGKTVLHCHILNHEDAGMMAIREIAK
ncbi:multicopper oxidase domain-containing protein [Streptomyces sp. NPDC001634]